MRGIIIIIIMTSCQLGQREEGEKSCELDKKGRKVANLTKKEEEEERRKNFPPVWLKPQ
jgi:hypothetical protein